MCNVLRVRITYSIKAFALGRTVFGEMGMKGLGLVSIRPHRLQTCRFQVSVILETALLRLNFGPVHEKMPNESGTT